jgi:succinoglycan biosynthesis protein ExoA
MMPEEGMAARNGRRPGQADGEALRTTSEAGEAAAWENRFRRIAERTVVCIPTLDEEAHIVRTLRHLTATDPVARLCPIVVADGGSTDGTRALVTALARTHPNIRLIENPARLQAAAVNAVASRFPEREFLVRCDAHAGYPPNYVQGLLVALRRHRADSVVVAMDTATEDTPTAFQRALVRIADSRLGAGGAAHRGGRHSGPVAHGHHAAFRLSTFRALGGYDPAFATNEDAEYDLRLTQQGGRIWLDASLRLRYFPRRSPGRLWRQYRRYGAGRARTCLKHRVRPGLRQALPLVNLAGLTVGTVGGALSQPGPGQGLLLAWPAAYAVLLVGVSLWSALRHREPAALWAGPAVGIMHLGWALGFAGHMLRSLTARAAGPEADG